MQTLGKYRILSKLGKGGFATVYRAEDTTLGREVALKVLDPLLMRDDAFVKRFHREARAAARLEHPHIVPVYEVGESDGRLFIAMRLVRGSNLGQAIAEQGRLSWEEMLDILKPVSKALAFAHQQDIIHRDIKPDNILLDKLSGALLSDFGFARLVSTSTLTQSISGGIVGTPAYIAPELWEGTAAGPPTDVYALACVVYEMLTGSALFQGETPMVVMRAHDQGAQLPESWPLDVPEDVADVLHRALARQPEDRYASIAAFVADLEAIQMAAVQDKIAAEAEQLYQAMQSAVEQGQFGSAMDLGAQLLELKPDHEVGQKLLTEARDKQNQRQALEAELAEKQADYRTEHQQVTKDKAALTTQTDELKQKHAELLDERGTLKSRLHEVKTALDAVERDQTETQEQLLEIESTEQRLEREANRWQKVQVLLGKGQLTDATQLLSKPKEDASQEAKGGSSRGASADKTRRPLTERIATLPLWLRGALGATVITLVVVLIIFLTSNPAQQTHELGDIQVRETDGMVMVYVPAGEFQMGSEDGTSNEEPVHMVSIDSFWIDKAEVTNARYEKCVDAGKCTPSQYANNEALNTKEQPVVGVSWYDAANYCEWSGARLPTEAEWEYAARGSSGLIYPWGNDWEIELANCAEDNCGDGYKRAAPAGAFPEGASWANALDMSGNVWEWVADWHEDDYYARSPNNNPTGPEEGDKRVLRGGSWSNNKWNVRSTNRLGRDPDTEVSDLGFRCAMSQ